MRMRTCAHVCSVCVSVARRFGMRLVGGCTCMHALISKLRGVCRVKRARVQLPRVKLGEPEGLRFFLHCRLYDRTGVPVPQSVRYQT